MLIVAPPRSRQSRFKVLLITTLWSLFFIVGGRAGSDNLVSACVESVSLGQFSKQDDNSQYIMTTPRGGYD